MEDTKTIEELDWKVQEKSAKEILRKLIAKDMVELLDTDMLLWKKNLLDALKFARMNIHNLESSDFEEFFEKCVEKWEYCKAYDCIKLWKLSQEYYVRLFEKCMEEDVLWLASNCIISGNLPIENYQRIFDTARFFRDIDIATIAVKQWNLDVDLEALAEEFFEKCLEQWEYGKTYDCIKWWSLPIEYNIRLFEVAMEEDLLELALNCIKWWGLSADYSIRLFEKAIVDNSLELALNCAVSGNLDGFYYQIIFDTAKLSKDINVATAAAKKWNLEVDLDALKEELKK